MKDIPFPKLYECFSGLESMRHIWLYTQTFWPLMEDVIRSGRLVIDQFVEDEVFGEDWESLFLKLTNNMAENVLYNPDQINYSVTDKSQEMFSRCMKAPMYIEVAQSAEKYNSLKSRRQDPSETEGGKTQEAAD